MTTVSMTRNEMLHRVADTCHAIMRNIAYHRALAEVAKRPSNITRTMHGNCLDLAVLDWLKLNNSTEQHSWRKVLQSTPDFEGDLLAAVGATADNWEAYLNLMKELRDKFVAHLDLKRVANLPKLDWAITSTEYYFRVVLLELDGPSSNYNLIDYYDACSAEGHLLATAMNQLPEHARIRVD